MIIMTAMPHYHKDKSHTEAGGEIRVSLEPVFWIDVGLRGRLYRQQASGSNGSRTLPSAGLLKEVKGSKPRRKQPTESLVPIT